MDINFENIEPSQIDHCSKFVLDQLINKIINLLLCMCKKQDILKIRPSNSNNSAKKLKNIANELLYYISMQSNYTIIDP